MYNVQTKFYIERRKDGAGNLLLKDRPVFMSVSFRGNRVMLGTGEKTDYSYWDPEHQRLKQNHPEALVTNTWLDTLEETARRAWMAIEQIPGDPGPELFRKKFIELKPRRSSGFFDVFIRFLDQGSERWATSTYQKVRTIFKHLREFENHTGRIITFEGMDEGFLRDFEGYYARNGNSKATTAKAVNIIVWFLNWATGEGFNMKTAYRRFYRQLDHRSGNTPLYPYLRWDELNRLLETRCETRREERVRDMFCFMCFTGLRFSELQRLSREDVGEREVVVRKKPGKTRRFPLGEEGQALLRKYANKYYLHNTAFPAVSIITFNKYLRMAGKRAGLERIISLPRSEGEGIPLYDRLTAGIAVHTFIANAIELHTPAAIIAGFTGVRNDARVRWISGEMARQSLTSGDNHRFAEEA